MTSWFRHLDDLLRGRLTSFERLAEGRIELSARRLTGLVLLLGALYGLFMGLFAVLRGGEGAWWQLLASVIKFPALFLLTLVVTFPSLYVFSALMGCRLSFIATLRLLVGAIAVNVTIAASLGPILGFFTLSTTSYPFMVLLNVALLAIAGTVALGFLLQALRRLALPWIPAPLWMPKPTAPEGVSPAGSAALVEPTAPRPPGALDPIPPQVDRDTLGSARAVFRIWVLIYGLVGAQMGWLLRPFIGNPNLEFEWFRHREGNFFQSVIYHLRHLIGE